MFVRSHGHARPRSRLALIALGAIAMTFAAVLSATSSAKPNAKASASTTLTILSQSSLQKGTDNMIAGFKKANPDIDVRASYVSSTAAMTQLLAAQVNAGNPPDITI